MIWHLDLELIHEHILHLLHIRDDTFCNLVIVSHSKLVIEHDLCAFERCQTTEQIVHKE
ncbi:hypothetical protein D3C80_2082580 [compost metagenome]